MNNQLFWSIIKEFNYLMKSSIIGPNCIDPLVCNGACCSIKIDVPRVLAEEYIRRNLAREDDFMRSNVFTFQLRFDEHTGKCFLFDKSLNGCRVHDSGIKPPQCWIYPTSFNNSEKKIISCKRASGWEIIDGLKTKRAEILLQKYVFLCKIEALKEIKDIKNRIGKRSTPYFDENVKNLLTLIKKVPPSSLGGFRDSWNGLKLLNAEGFSLQMKKFCIEHNNQCLYLPDRFIECKSTCDLIANRIIEFLHENIQDFIRKNDPDTNGEYPLYKLFKFNENKYLKH